MVVGKVGTTTVNIAVLLELSKTRDLAEVTPSMQQRFSIQVKNFA